MKYILAAAFATLLLGPAASQAQISQRIAVDIVVCWNGTLAVKGQSSCPIPVPAPPPAPPPAPAPVPVPVPVPVPAPAPSAAITLSRPLNMLAGQVLENRSYTYALGHGSQAIFFQIEPGDDNVTIRNVRTQGGYEVIRAGGGAITGITIDGLYSKGVRRSCFWGRGTDVKNVVIRNVDCEGDLTFLPTTMGDLREGIALQTPYDTVLIENVLISGFRMAMPPGEYNNGDGLATERKVKNLTLRRVVSNDNTDGGFDLKADNMIADDLYATRNKRNYRFWANVFATKLSCGDFFSACIWANGVSGKDPTHPSQTIMIDLLFVRAGPNSKGTILLGGNTIKPIFNIKACDIQGPAGMVIAAGISSKSVLGPGCNVVKPYTEPLVIPNVVGGQ